MCPDNTMLVATKFQSRLINPGCASRSSPTYNHFQGDAKPKLQVTRNKLPTFKTKIKSTIFANPLCDCSVSWVQVNPKVGCTSSTRWLLAFVYRSPPLVSLRSRCSRSVLVGRGTEWLQSLHVAGWVDCR